MMSGHLMRSIMVVMLCGIMLAGLAACGKKPGILKPPTGQDGASAPATYPASKDDL